MTPLRYVGRLVVVVLAASATSLALPHPANAATCSTAHGVSVVVDFHQLGGGVQTACDGSGAGKYAAAQFEDVGHTLTPVQRDPGFVCRVDGVPSNDPCVNDPPSDAYWSLWWSDGRSGTWQYASTGASSLKVPAGGYVALSWQGGTGKAKPGVAPTAHATTSPSPSSPTPHPSQQPAPPTHSTAGASASPTGASRPPASPTAGSGARATRGPHHHDSPTARASRAHHPEGHHRHPGDRTAGPVAQAGGAPQVASAGEGGSGLPGWVAPGAVALLFLAGGTVAVVRRRRSGST